MVGADAGRDVGVKRRPANTGCVPVDVICQPGAQLGELRWPACDHSWEIHHLRHADGAATAQQTLDVTRREGPPRGLELRGGNTRGGHDKDIEGQIRAAVEQPVNAIGAEHVGDLVGVRDHCRGPVRKDGAGKLVDHQLGRLDVHVRIDEARDQVRA